MGPHPLTCGKTRWQGEGGEQGRPLDAHVVCTWAAQGFAGNSGTSLGRGARLRFPGRYPCGVHAGKGRKRLHIIQQELFAHARISVHHGKTQVWNRGRIVPQDIDIITAAARVQVPDAVVWRGAQELPATKQRLRLRKFLAPDGVP